MTTVYLSIDWDFFVREDPLWDFGHTERGPLANLLPCLWQAREFGFAVGGCDLVEEMSPATHAYPAPRDLYATLRKSLRLLFSLSSPGSFAVGDSHVHAHKHYSGQDLVINLDAHHDLGYGSRPPSIVEGVEAGSWLWHVLAANPGASAHCVFPDWQPDGYADIPDFCDGVLERATATHVRDYLRGPVQKPLVVTGVYVARSGAWTPPWTDPQFLEFVSSLEEDLGQTPELLGDSNVLVPREYSPVELPTGLAV